MNLNTLCPPAMIFVIFCTVQIVFDILRQVYNTAFFKAVVLVMGTFMLNMLCKQGLSLVSWIFIFIPFIFLTTIVAILLYTFGLDPATGTLNLTCNDEKTGSDTDKESDDSNSDNYVISHGNVVYL